jgi:hypothetical protein
VCCAVAIELDQGEEVVGWEGEVDMAECSG